MNKGYTPDELVEVVALPPHLAEHPWLGEYYGTVKHAVRQIYVGYLGWFQADPWALDPLPRMERANRYVELMGGRDAVIKAAREAVDDGEHTWAAEILTNVIRIDHNDMEARRLKAEAYRKFAYSGRQKAFSRGLPRTPRVDPGSQPNGIAFRTSKLEKRGAARRGARGAALGGARRGFRVRARDAPRSLFAGADGSVPGRSSRTR